MSGQLFIGTSGYAYPEWKPAFYPEKTKQADFLRYYSERLSTVEINNSFYRFPSASAMEGWRDQVPDEFRFAIKANQRITHISRLKDVGDTVRDFAERCAALGDKMGPILYQCPPNLKRDDDVLRAFCTTLPRAVRHAIEFRNKSWFDDAVYEILREFSVALVLSEDGKLATPRELTAEWAYLRLRRDDYSDDDLAEWSSWISAQTEAGTDIFAYLKHDETGESPMRALSILGRQT
ncbi:MAG: DUF72 domain-containing protein [Phycisphaerales bacterium]|nr:DUF72 domain-containing protein [Phycisphaerales bacterium]